MCVQCEVFGGYSRLVFLSITVSVRCQTVELISSYRTSVAVDFLHQYLFSSLCFNDHLHVQTIANCIHLYGKSRYTRSYRIL